MMSESSDKQTDSASHRAISAQLVPASDETLATMRARFFTKLRTLTDTAAGPDASPELRQATWLYCYNASKNRQLPSVAKLKELTAQGPDHVHKKRRVLPTKIKTGLAKKILNEAAKCRESRDFYLCAQYNKEKMIFYKSYPLWRQLDQDQTATPLEAFGPPPPLHRLSGQEQALDNLFSDRDRLYFHLDDHSRSPVKPLVENALAALGYKDIDYNEGYASDHRKNKRKIGKLLKDRPGLLRAFQSDPCRNKADLMVVISRHPYDIGRGSYGRGWESCRANKIQTITDGGKESAIGVLAAYLIRADDPNIHDPLSRIFIKPHFGDCLDENGKEKGFGFIYKSFTPIGLHHPGFLAAVNDFTDRHFNQDKYGTFYLPQDFCEYYQENLHTMRLPQNAEKALSMLSKEFDRAANGQITIDDDLKLRRHGLHSLPDLRDVIVTGTIDVSNNKLQSLQGLPEYPAGSLYCHDNLIVSFEDCTMKQVRKYLNYRANPFLLSAHAIPQARGYRYGNQIDIMDDEADAEHTGTRPRCPTTHPDIFPGLRAKPL